MPRSWKVQEACLDKQRRYYSRWYAVVRILQYVVISLIPFFEGLRDYQDDKADIIHKYTSDEARQLKTIGELPEKGAIFFSSPFLVN